MSVYLMKITPQEPYFFGNEKTFGFPGAKNTANVNRYYISGERVPAQTTVLGTLRYMLLPVKKSDYSYTADETQKNKNTIGEKSFCYGEDNRFGKIKNVSPVFLLLHDEILIPTPYDHVKGKKTYTPFSEYKPCGGSNTKVYAPEFNAKNGIEDSYVNLKGEIYPSDAIFGTDTRIGINRASHDFFKKSYAVLKDGFSFGVYIELDDSLTPEDGIAYMGQGKSLFTVAFIKQESENAKAHLYASVASMLSGGAVYCLSDVFVKGDVYELTKASITSTKEYRAYTTDGGKVSKHSILYKQIKAGSVFLPKDYEALKKMIADESVEVIGYNQIVSQEEKYI